MQVKQGDKSLLDARAKAEPADNVVTPDFYTQLPQIRLSPNPNSRQKYLDLPTEVLLDDIDVAMLVECAVRHPAVNMRQGVLTAIRNHPESFRQILQFGLDAPASFTEIRKIVAEELAKRPRAPESPTSRASSQRTAPLLPRMPLPEHLRDRQTKGTGQAE